MTDRSERAKFAEVAGLLGAGWALAERQNYPYLLEHADGRTVVVREHNGRYEIRAATSPHDFSADERQAGLRRRHEITASAAKSPASLAADITGRLLPGYEASLAVVAAAAQAAGARQARRVALIDLLVKAGQQAGAQRCTAWQGDVIDCAQLPSNDQATQVSGRFTPDYGANVVMIELHMVPPDLAVAVMTLIATQALGGAS